MDQQNLLVKSVGNTSCFQYFRGGLFQLIMHIFPL